MYFYIRFYYFYVDYIDHYLIYKNISFEIFLYIYIKLNIFYDSYFLKFHKCDFQCNLDWKLLHARLFEIFLMMSILLCLKKIIKLFLLKLSLSEFFVSETLKGIFIIIYFIFFTFLYESFIGILKWYYLKNSVNF